MGRVHFLQAGSWTGHPDYVVQNTHAHTPPNTPQTAQSGMAQDAGGSSGGCAQLLQCQEATGSCTERRLTISPDRAEGMGALWTPRLNTQCIGVRCEAHCHSPSTADTQRETSAPLRHTHTLNVKNRAPHTCTHALCDGYWLPPDPC